MKSLACWIRGAVLGLTLLPGMACADDFDAARAAIRKHMQEHRIPATAVALWRDGRIVWEEGFGLADREKGIAATPHTMFYLASLSKPMTTVAVMTLVQAGQVDLDRPINDYLGEDGVTVRVGDPTAVTVRRVADHTSGLAASSQFFYGQEAALVPSMSETIRRYGIVVAPPGERHWYSNIGYGILGHLVERVSGKPYADYMRQDVFLPLGMRHSALDIPAGLERQHAIRYDYDRHPIPYYVSAEPASASVYSSAHDLARFGMFMLKNRVPDGTAVLDPASIDEMSRAPVVTASVPARVAAAGENGYGLGLGVGHMGGYRTIGHGGSTSGVSSNLILVPSANVGLVMLANVDGGLSNDIMRDILKTQLPDWRDPAEDAVRPAPPGPSKAGFVPPPELVGQWVGEVHTADGPRPIRLKLSANGDARVRIGDEPRWAGRSTQVQDALVNDLAYRDGLLTGNALSQIESTDTRRRGLQHTVALRLALRDDGTLAGTTMSSSVFTGFWQSNLPHWTRLERSADES